MPTAKRNRKVKRARGVTKGLTPEQKKLRQTLLLPVNRIRRDPTKPPPPPKGLTAKVLLRYAKRTSLKNATAVRIYVTYTARVKDKPGLFRFVAAKLPRDLRTGIIQPKTFWVRSLQPTLPLSRAKLQVECNCEDDLYTYNYARDRHGACVRPKHNGEPPDVRNPNMWPGVCCHGVAILEWILETDAAKPQYFEKRPYLKATDVSHL